MEWINLPGLVEYETGLKVMEERLNLVIEKKAPEAIYLLEHRDVYTAGTGFKQNELLDNTNIPVIYTGRGGKFTYHGPGQRVIYPVLDLAKKGRTKDIKLYVKTLEEWIIATLAGVGLKAYTIEGMVGIWTDKGGTPAKIGAIGIRVKKWVTFHGIAVNITTDITKYAGIIPCGINNFPVTSLKDLGVEISLRDFDFLLKDEFKKNYFK
jgi:lipoyl(octanoyl) transferase